MLMSTRLLRPVGAAVLGLVAASAAQAYKFNALDQLQSQGEFRQLSEDLSATLVDRQHAPASGLGLIGFDVALTAGGTSIQSKAIVERATGSSNVPGTLPTVALRAQKGLPFGVDLGVSYTMVPGSSVSAVGGSVKWAFVEGGVLTPAVAVRLHANQANGLGEMSLRSQGVDLSISKGFAFFTPYAGVGVVASQASTKNDRWAAERYTQTRVFAGANLNLLVTNLAFEADKTGKDTTVSVKFGVRF